MEQIKNRLKAFPEGREVYDKIQPVAEGVKAIIQVFIGIISVVILIVQVCIHLSENAVKLGNLALAVIGVALAFSAAVELAYTFFTDGPDEALDPLILGLSAFTLIEISRNTAHLRNVAVPVLLIAAAIVVLFIARRFLVQVRRKETRKAGKGMHADSHDSALPKVADGE